MKKTFDEINADNRFEQEQTKEVSHQEKKHLAIHPKRVMVFWGFALCMAITILAGACAVVKTSDNSASFYSLEEYFESGSFQERCHEWVRNLKNYLFVTDPNIKEAILYTDLNENQKLYRLGEYHDFAKEYKDNKGDAKLDFSALSKEVTLGDWMSRDGKVEGVSEDVLLGQCNGSQYYFYYENLAHEIELYQEKTGDKSGTATQFLHLTKAQYDSLLDRYLMSKEELIQAGYEIGYYERTDKEGNLVEVPIEKVDDETDSFVAQGQEEYPDYAGSALPEYLLTNEKCLAFIHPKTHNWVLRTNANETYSLELQLVSNLSESCYNYTTENLRDITDLYFPAAMLDFSSLEQLEMSLLTTPFSTVENSMVYLSQTYDESVLAQYDEHYNNVLAQYDEYYDNNLLHQFDYEITGVDFNHQEYHITEGFVDEETNRKDAFFLIHYDAATKTCKVTDSDLEKLSLTVDIAEDLEDVAWLESLCIAVPKRIGLNPYSVDLVNIWLDSNTTTIYVCLSVFGLLSLFLLVVLLWIQPWELYGRDRHLLVVRTMVYGASLLALGCLAMLFLEVIVSGGIPLYDGASQLVFLCIVALLLYLAIYGIFMDYLLGLLRWVKHGSIGDNLCLVRMLRKLAFRRRIQDLLANRSIAKQSLIYAGGYFWANVFVMGIFGLIAVDFQEGYVLFIGFFICLVGNVFLWRRLFRDRKHTEEILNGIKRIAEGDLSYQIDHSQMTGYKKDLAVHINRIGEGLDKAVDQSVRDERLKAELITNVSHDIKTPLTSIINYVDLIKRENVETEPLASYVEVLDQKSQRLKQLIEDLVEASKASTGNLELQMEKLNMTELVNQAIGEFEDKFRDRQLSLITQIEEYNMTIFADGRRCYRVIENLFQNIYKYAMPNTRVYLSLNLKNGNVEFILRNISEAPLNLDVEELTQRFVRGDESRTTEGSGLGLSIAKSLTQLQGGTLEVALDGDLFKVIVSFPQGKEE